MSTRDDDILDFDFFDEEDATSWEEPEGTRDPHLRAPSGVVVGVARASGRLRTSRRFFASSGLIALAILVIVLLGRLGRGLHRGAQRDRNSTYLADIGSIGNASAKLGQQGVHAPDDPWAEQRRTSTREARRLRADGRQPDAAGRGS